MLNPFTKLEEFLYRPSVKRVLDDSIVGGCPYCTALRAVLFGVGLGMFSVFGLFLMALAVALNHLERFLNDKI